MENQSIDQPEGNEESFPRSTICPKQSPLFWVAQKDRYLRQLLIRDIQSITNRKLVVYFGNRAEASSGIEPRDVSHWAEMLGNLTNQSLDIFLETSGGQTDATEAIISLIENTVKDVRVIVANAAKSNGTLLALLSQTIIMGPTSELGPIEPSLGEIPCSILETDQVKISNFALHSLGKYALEQSKKIATRLLSKGMLSKKNQQEIEKVVECLSTRKKFPSHGSVLDYKEASELGLSVTYLPFEDDLWKKIWLLYCMYDYDCRSKKYLKIFESCSRSIPLATSS